MANDILRVHIDETLTSIKQTGDDRSISRAQVAYCYIIVSNTLLGQHIGKRDSGAFLTVFDNIPIIVAGQSTNPNVVKDRKYIELPGMIFDFDKDQGVEYLAYVSDGGPQCPPRFTRVPFTRTSPSEAQWLYKHPSTAPSPKNPYWYRVGSLIYTLGIENVPVKELESGIYMTIDPLQEIDIDQPFNFPQELLHVLKRQVVDLIRFNWFFPKDRQNSGDDDPSAKANLQKITSVNDQGQQ